MSQTTTPTTAPTPTPTDTRPWHESLVELLEAQQGIMNELAGLAEHQSQLIEQARTEDLLGLLTRRQQLIERFTATQNDLGELTEDLDARMQALTVERREQIQNLLQNISQHLGQVMACDERDQASLEQARNTSRQRLSAVDSGRQARNAYLGSRTATTRFADRKG